MTRFAATTLLLLPIAASAQQPPQQNVPSVVVTVGEGVVKAAPDQETITISGESRGSTPKEAQQKNAAAMNPVVGRLRATGIPSDAMRTVSYQLQPDWDPRSGKIRGYIARNSIAVRVDAVDRVGELVDIVVMAGATSVTNIQFDIKERERLEREALRMAVSDARARATAAAAGAGLTVDRVLRIEEPNAAALPVPFRTLQETVTVAGAAPPPTPPIEAGEIEIRTRVTVTTLLK